MEILMQCLRTLTTVLKIIIGGSIPEPDIKLKLGKDANASNDAVVLTSGHAFVKEKKGLTVYIPEKVKRGRIPFKRKTPGRHITDEIIEPLFANDISKSWNDICTRFDFGG